MKVHAYIINLKRCEARRKTILERLAAFPEIEPEIVEAVDAQAEGTEAMQKHAAPASVIFRNCLEHSLSNGEIACALSHLKCLEMIAAGKDEIGLLLEDDALLAPEFGQAAAAALEVLAKETRPALILFSARTWRYGHRQNKWHGPGNLFRSTNGVGTYAYAVNRAGAKLMAKTSLPLIAPFDHWHLKCRAGLRLYTIVPHVASFVGDNDDSTIRDERIEKWKTGSEYWKKRPRIWLWMAHKFRRIALLNAFHRIFQSGKFEGKRW
ncbi:MAG: glycosyltransferase family 25 protein [Kiritimatiellia bacterium]